MLSPKCPLFGGSTVYHRFHLKPRNNQFTELSKVYKECSVSGIGTVVVGAANVRLQ